ncbi:MAG: GDSL-type esterase/lipase family protein [Magnetovibrio sp.]|nr:GDSL-type esterase/lipase family protein [Magnetovibrio sp.]
MNATPPDEPGPGAGTGADRRRSAAAAAFLVAISVMIAAGLFEIGLRLFHPQDLSGRWLHRLPDGPAINRPDGAARHQFGDRVVRYRFNRFGQRNANADLKACRRALVLGDSFTFGWLLNRGETFVGRLQARLDARRDGCPWTLLNAAAGGWGTADQLRYLERFGADIRPDAVVVFIGIDDFERARLRDTYRVAPDTGELTFHPAPPPDAGFAGVIRRIPGYQWFLEHSHLVQLARKSVVGSRNRQRPAAGAPTAGTAARPAPRAELAAYGPGHAELVTALFRRMAAWCRRNGVELVVLTNGWPRTPIPWFGDALRDAGIHLHDLRPRVAPAVNADRAAYVIAGDGHPSAAGAGLIADAAWPVIDRALAPK